MTRFRSSDSTADPAIRAADRAPRMSTDLALRLAADAKLRGDMLGHDRFMAAARRGGAQ